MDVGTSAITIIPARDPGASTENENGGCESLGEPTGSARGTGELSPAIDNFGSGNSNGDSPAEAPKRKRGRPAGSGKASPSTTGTSAKPKSVSVARGELRRRLADTGIGLIQFGLSAYGTTRADQVKPVSIHLANAVYKNWCVSEEEAKTVAEPLAECLVEYLPDKFLAGVANVANPIQVLAAAYMIFTRRQEAERQMVEEVIAKIQVDRMAREATEPEISPAEPVTDRFDLNLT